VLVKLKLFSLFFFVFASLFYSQKRYILGNVKNEIHKDIPDTYIYNPRTEELTVTDISGNFIISAIASDELRVVKKGYERTYIKISDDEFTKPVEVVLSKIPYEIPEVEIAFNPTGDLKKDLGYFKTSEKTARLNTEMTDYMKGPMNSPIPQNKIPSAFAPPDFSAGQANVLGILSAAAGLLKKATSPAVTTPNFAETQDFYRRVKDVVDINYFKGYGMSEYDFEIFLAYVDKTASLTKRFHKNFNKAAIESELKLALVNYLKTHKLDS